MELAMKLSSDHVERTLSQYEAEAIPPNHPALPQLTQLFGDHTFFLNPDGLTIVEPTATDRGVGEVVKLAGWTDGAHTTLAPESPEAMPVVIALKA